MAKNKDLRVGVSLGGTFPIPDVDYGMIKPEIRIDGLDPTKDLDEQFELAMEVATSGLEKASEELGKQLASVTPRDHIDKLAATVKSVNERLGAVIRKLNEDAEAEKEALRIEEEVSKLAAETAEANADD